MECAIRRVIEKPGVADVPREREREREEVEGVRTGQILVILVL